MQIPNKDWREKKESVQNLLDIIIVVSCCWKYANVPKGSSLFKKDGPEETVLPILWNSWIKVREQYPPWTQF